MSDSDKVVIIAEIGSTHDGSFGNAKCLIDVAAECGVDAVKFQTHIAEAETLPNAPMPPYFKEEPRFEYFNRTAFSKKQWVQLKKHAENPGLLFLSSPFSIEAIHLLEEIDIQQYKIPSGEVTNLPLIEEIAKTGKPVLLSSGMSSWDELDRAINLILNYHNHLTLMQCTSEYPCPYTRVGLNVMLEMRNRYNLPVGLSDHTLSNYASFAAVTLGAQVIERHFAFSRRMYGSDAKHSLEPQELKELVCGVRAIETILSSAVNKSDVSSVQDMKKMFEKSIVPLIDLSSGTVLKKEMLGTRRPGNGISPTRLDEVIGKRIKKDLKAFSILRDDDFS